MSSLSWGVAYVNSFLRTDKWIFNYMTTKKDNRLWIGTIEAILAICYNRFRPGAKFNLKKEFKIGNDHTHPVKIGDYQFDLQGLKRLAFGGSSSDLLNFKTPVYYSKSVLDKLRPENRAIILTIGREAIQSLLDTYNSDIMAREALKSLDFILKMFQNDDNVEDFEDLLCINDEYMRSPLTKKNIELWEGNIDVLNRICHLYKETYDENRAGRNIEKYLTEIKKLQEEVRTQLVQYLLEIPKGN